MALIDLIANDLAGNLETLKHHLADFSDADIMVRPVPADLTAIRALWLKRRPRIRRKTLAANPVMIVQHRPPRRG